MVHTLTMGNGLRSSLEGHSYYEGIFGTERALLNVSLTQSGALLINLEGYGDPPAPRSHAGKFGGKHKKQTVPVRESQESRTRW